MIVTAKSFRELAKERRAAAGRETARLTRERDAAKAAAMRAEVEYTDPELTAAYKALIAAKLKEPKPVPGQLRRTRRFGLRSFVE